jgi:nucleoside-diphosphate-sugar epimerase
MRVLLTGGYGCIGSWIVRELLRRGDEVCIYDLKQDPRRMRLLMSEEQVGRTTFIQGDVTNLPSLKAAVAAHQITHIVHLAGLMVPACRADPILGAKVNVQGTLAVFEAARESKGQVQRIVYASSAAVFGPPEDYPAGPLGDDVKLSPSTHYGYFKCCNEGNARVFFRDHGLSSVGLRPWTVYGLGRDLGMTCEPTTAIKALAVGRPYRITYGGTQDLQYVEDVAAVFVRCLESPYQGGKSYNLRGAVVTMETFRKALCAADPKAANLITFGEQQLPIAYNLDDSALQRDLGPMPYTPLEEGVRRTLEHFRRLQSEGRLDASDLKT